MKHVTKLIGLFSSVLIFLASLVCVFIGACVPIDGNDTSNVIPTQFRGKWKRLPSTGDDYVDMMTISARELNNGAVLSVKYDANNDTITIVRKDRIAGSIEMRFYLYDDALFRTDPFVRVPEYRYVRLAE